MVRLSEHESVEIFDEEVMFFVPLFYEEQVQCFLEFPSLET